MIDFDQDGYFSLMDESSNTRDDLKYSEHCAVDDVQAVRDMFTKAQDDNSSLIVSIPH